MQTVPTSHMTHVLQRKYNGLVHNSLRVTFCGVTLCVA